MKNRIVIEMIFALFMFYAVRLPDAFLLLIKN